MTAAMDIRFKKAVPIGQAVTVQAFGTGARGRLVTLAAEVRLEDGTVAATARFLEVD